MKNTTIFLLLVTLTLGLRTHHHHRHRADSNIGSGFKKPDAQELFESQSEYFEHRWCDADSDWCYTITYTCTGKSSDQCDSEWKQIEDHFFDCISDKDNSQDHCIDETTEWSNQLLNATPESGESSLAKSRCTCESFVQASSGCRCASAMAKSSSSIDMDDRCSTCSSALVKSKSESSFEAKLKHKHVFTDECSCA